MRGRARAARGRARAVRSLGRARHRDRRGHRHRSTCASSTATSWWATCRSTRSSTSARCTTWSPRSRPRRCTRTRRRACRPKRSAGETLLALLASPNIASKRFVFEQYDPIVGSRTDPAPAVGGRRGARARARRRHRGDRGQHRRERTARGVRSVHGRGRGRARVRAQPRLRRRRAARPHQLPQLRQPGEAAHRVAAHARGRRAAATPAWRSACRWWAATCRSTTRAARGRSTRRRSWAWSGSCPSLTPCRAPASRRRATRSRWSARSSRRSTGSELEKLRGRLGDSLPPLDLAAHADALRAGARGGARAARLRRPTTSPTAGSPCALAECCIEGGIGATGRARSTTARPRCSARAPGGVVVAGPREVHRVSRCRRRDRRGGRREPEHRRRARRAGGRPPLRLRGRDSGGVRRLARCYPRPSTR